jgi:hypothetical protein
MWIWGDTSTVRTMVGGIQERVFLDFEVIISQYIDITTGRNISLSSKI